MEMFFLLLIVAFEQMCGIPTVHGSIPFFRLQIRTNTFSLGLEIELVNDEQKNVTIDVRSGNWGVAVNNVDLLREKILN